MGITILALFSSVIKAPFLGSFLIYLTAVTA